MTIYTGGTGDHSRVEISPYAFRRLEGLRKSDPKLYGRILAAVKYYFDTWIPGDAEPDGVQYFSRLSVATSHQVYRIKDKDLLGEWRLIIMFVPFPPKNPMLAELFLWKSNKESYDDLAAEHNANVRKLVQELVLAGRMKRRS